jgi:transcription initiation factor IIE alpha subunit
MAKSRTDSLQTNREEVATAPAPIQSEAPKRPGGKLGLIVEHLEAETGATADELAEATGWRRNTVLGALSRLRARGFAMHLATEGDRKAYRLEKVEG